MLPLAGAILANVAPGFGTQSDWVGNFADAGVFILLACGLNVVVGGAGLLDLGYAAFFAIGAYTYAYGASTFTSFNLPFWVMIFLAAGVAAVFGILLGAPTLRLRGDYLAIVTLGFGEIVPVVILNSDTYTRGTNGITGLAQPSLYGLFGINSFGFQAPFLYFFTVLAIITVVFILLYRLQDSRLGRAWAAIREDELAASSMGINTVTTKLLAFAIGASTCRPGWRVLRIQARHRVARAIRLQRVIHGAGHGRPGRHGQHLGRRRGRVHHLQIQHQGLKQLGDFVQSLHIAPINLYVVTIDLRRSTSSTTSSCSTAWRS